MADLNEAAIKAAQPGDVLRDAKITGLHLRAFAGRKSFYLYFRTKAGVERKPKLGDHGSITLAQARKVASELLVEVALGRDPVAQRDEAKAERTLDDLWAEYWKRHGSKKKSASDDLEIYEAKVKAQLGGRKLSAVGYPDIADMHESMKATPYRANRTLALLSKMFSFAHRPLEWTDKNPCKGVKRFPEAKRRRYATADETRAIAAQLKAEAVANPASVAFILLLIFTGARKGEIAAARWTDLDGHRLFLSRHKTDRSGHARIIHLPTAALTVLANLPRTNGTLTGILSPTKLWEKIRKASGCPDLRMHDLRRTFASVALGGGVSLEQIGGLLGHESTQTTKGYAWLMDEVGAAAANATADRITERMLLTQETT